MHNYLEHFNFGFSSPLEQFLIVPIIPLNFFFFDFSITNVTFTFFIVFVGFFFLLKQIFFSEKKLYIIPSRFQSVFELIFLLNVGIIKENMQFENKQEYVPLIVTIFFFVASYNLIGIIPYFFTVTSHIIITFTLSIGLFIGITIIGIIEHKEKIFSLFLPKNTSFFLGFLLVPIEIISFIFKPISLSIRLFANIMAGHILLHVIAGFAWSISSFVFYFSILQFLIFPVLIFLIGLEILIAIIQAYVFCVLISIYLNDSINLH